MQPIFLGWLISYFSEDSRDDEYAGYLYGFLVIVCSVITVWIIHPYMLSILHLGMKIRVATCSLAYRKVSIMSCYIFLGLLLFFSAPLLGLNSSFFSFFSAITS